MSHDILIVDDEKDICTLIEGILQDEGYAVRQAENAKQAYKEINTKAPDLMVLDIWLQGSDKDGLEILDDIHTQHPLLPILMISGHGTIETAVKAIKKGAYDFVEKPFKSDRLILMIQRALETARLKTENETLKIKTQISAEFLGDSAYAQSMRRTIAQAADSNSRVLITGEAGTGKNVIARAIHAQSERKDQSFVSLSSESFNENDLEDIFEHTANGTIFIEDIVNLSAKTQSRLMKLFQDNPNIRIIAATNRDIDKALTEGALNNDLYQRLNVSRIETSPLSERQQDIPVLADYFIKQCAAQSDLKPITLSDGAKACLQTMTWKGNARSLKNFMEQLLIKFSGQSDPVSPQQISRPNGLDEHSNESSSTIPANDYIGLPLKDARDKFEKAYLQSQLSRFDGNISKTAKFVGMERSALHRKMKSLDILSSDKQDEEKAESSSASSNV